MNGANGHMMIDVNAAAVHHLRSLMAHAGLTTIVLSHTLLVVIQVQGIEMLLVKERRRQCGSTRTREATQQGHKMYTTVYAVRSLVATWF